MIEAGKLNAKVVIQSPTDTQSQSGEVTLGWTNLDTVWANIAPLSAREINIAKRLCQYLFSQDYHQIQNRCDKQDACSLWQQGFLYQWGY